MAGSDESSWSLKDICWRKVVLLQSWSTCIALIFVIVANVVLNELEVYNNLPFLVYDATISYPYRQSTIPYWAAVLTSWFAIILSAIAGEVWIAGDRVHKSMSDALAATVHVVLDGSLAGLITGVFTQVLKVSVGRLRPDYLSLCNPAIPDDIMIQIGQPASANPVCNPTLSNGKVIDGRWSFPSGHASTAFSLISYAVIYMIWTSYWRVGTYRYSLSTSKLVRLRKEIGSALVLLWIMLLWTFAWAVGASRITDFKHHASDVIAGALLGIVIATSTFGRGISVLATTPDPDTPRRGLLDEERTLT